MTAAEDMYGFRGSRQAQAEHVVLQILHDIDGRARQLGEPFDDAPLAIVRLRVGVQRPEQGESKDESKEMCAGQNK